MTDNDNSTDASGSSPPKPESTLAASMMQNPQLLQALQERLGGIVGASSGYIESLPKPVKRRIKALKNLQVSCMKVEAEFYKEVHALECKYAEKFKPLYEKRFQVASGEYEPNDEECEWESDDDDDGDDDESKKDEENSEEKLSNELKDKASLDEDRVIELQASEEVQGIPEFWFTAMKNVDPIADMIQEHDEPILKHLTDINLEFIDEEKPSEASEESNGVTMGFVLEFKFSPNPYFNNSTLTKTYKLSCEVDKDSPFSFEGPEITSTSGHNFVFKMAVDMLDAPCINGGLEKGGIPVRDTETETDTAILRLCYHTGSRKWKKGKNVTQKVIKKKQKHKGKGQAKYVNKTVKNDSFFNFFAPPEVPEDGEMDEDTETLLEADFEIGHFFRERLIPKAVLYFTGEAMEGEEFEEEEEEEEEEGEDQDGGDGEDEDDDQDPDYKPQDGKPPECKQQ